MKKKICPYCGKVFSLEKYDLHRCIQIPQKMEKTFAEKCINCEYGVDEKCTYYSPNYRCVYDHSCMNCLWRREIYYHSCLEKKVKGHYRTIKDHRVWTKPYTRSKKKMDFYNECHNPKYVDARGNIFERPEARIDENYICDDYEPVIVD